MPAVEIHPETFARSVAMFLRCYRSQEQVRSRGSLQSPLDCCLASEIFQLRDALSSLCESPPRVRYRVSWQNSADEMKKKISLFGIDSFTALGSPLNCQDRLMEPWTPAKCDASCDNSLVAAVL